jgi:hypothetical protein
MYSGPLLTKGTNTRAAARSWLTPLNGQPGRGILSAIFQRASWSRLLVKMRKEWSENTTQRGRWSLFS